MAFWMPMLLMMFAPVFNGTRLSKTKASADNLRLLSSPSTVCWLLMLH
jgi:hypothetical protein